MFSKIYILSFWIILIVAYCEGAASAVDDMEAEKSKTGVVGGLCEYKRHKGNAVIVSISPKASPNCCAGSFYTNYEVKFRFIPDEEITESYGNVQAREHVLMLTNSWYPGPKFLQKYKIEIGKSFVCHLKTIIKGTCTPIIFDFQTIDLNNYFEINKDSKD